MGNKKSRDILKVLLDPGSTKTLINKKSVPRGANTKSLGGARKVSTPKGLSLTPITIMVVHTIGTKKI